MAKCLKKKETTNGSLIIKSSLICKRLVLYVCFFTQNILTFHRNKVLLPTFLHGSVTLGNNITKDCVQSNQSINESINQSKKMRKSHLPGFHLRESNTLLFLLYQTLSKSVNQSVTPSYYQCG